jgi:hypothetical protein
MVARFELSLPQDDMITKPGMKGAARLMGRKVKNCVVERRNGTGSPLYMMGTILRMASSPSVLWAFC